MRKSRPANAGDAAAIASIYNQGIEDRVATFETRLRTEADVLKWLDGRHAVVVVEESRCDPLRRADGVRALDWNRG